MINKGLHGLQMISLLALLAGLSLVVSSCGPRIVVNMAEAVDSNTETRSLQLRNCGCDTELLYDLEIQNTYEIDDYMYSGNQKNPQLVLPETMAELNAELERAYAPLIEQAEIEAHQIQLTVPAEKIREFKIDWKTNIYTSTISLRKGLKVYSVSYTYELSSPEEAGYIEIPCTP